VENNYYHRPIEEQIASLVKVNGFWKDYARHTGDGPFLSTCVAEASGSFTEMMAALAVLDLPFAAPEHKPEYQGARMSLRAGGRAVAFHKQIRETAAPGKSQLVLVGQNFFALDDRYRFENNERFDKFVTDEFRARRVYGCQVVLTNPTSSRRKVDALLQIPAGAVPVLNGFATRSLHRQLEPYSTQTIECHFYFPAAGEYAHYPVHVAQEEQTIAAAEPFTFKVVDQLSVVDKTSWPYVSQYGTDDEMLQHLRTNNIDRLDLGLIAFRMRERGVFDKTLDLLRSRHVYQDTLWSYGVYHNAPGPIREYLPHTPFADRCGPCIVSELLTLDPVARYVYQHKEYWPLVNPRVHPLGKTRKILNEAFSAQYQQFLTCLAYRPAMDAQDLLGATVYLLLQDRVEEALKFYGRVPAEASRGNILYDYLTAYLLLSRGKADEARQAAAAYAEYPVDRWRNLFRDVLAQADEAAGAAAKVVDKEDRAQVQTELAASEATLDFKVESRKITVRYQNVKSCVIRYYPMDIELLFSRNPFVQDVGGQFSVVQPGAVADVPLPPGKDSVSVELPKAYQDRNVMIEVSGGGVTRAQAYYPNSLNVQLTEGYGQLRVQHEQTGKPLAQVYVKVYARDAGGRVSFYKDGYTDLRGRFDYSSLNTGEISDVERFAILVLSESAGALVREAAPPKL
jgi:hypothetical protein